MESRVRGESVQCGTYKKIFERACMAVGAVVVVVGSWSALALALTLLVLQCTDTPIRLVFEVSCAQNGSAVLKGFEDRGLFGTASPNGNRPKE